MTLFDEDDTPAPAYFRFKKPTDSAATLIQALSKMLRSKMTPGMRVSRIEIILAESGLQPIKMKDSGLRHLALITDDFDADYQNIKASGVNFLSEPGIRGGNQVVFFQDPEGNVLHLIKRPVPLA